MSRDAIDFIAFFEEDEQVIKKIEDVLGIKFQNINKEKGFIYVGVKSFAFGDVIRKLRAHLLKKITYREREEDITSMSIDVWG